MNNRFKDPLTIALQNRGFHPRAHHPFDADFIVGFEVLFQHMQVTYHLQENSLTISHIESRNTQGLSSTAQSLLDFVDFIKKNVPDIHVIRGRIFPLLGDIKTQQNKQKLLTFLQAQGAKWVTINDERWLEYKL